MAEMTLAEKKEWTNIDGLVKQEADNMNNNLGAKIAVDVNKESFKAHPTDAYYGKNYIATYLVSAGNALNNVCNSSPDAKETVMSKVQKINLTYGTPAYTLNAGTLTITTDLGVTQSPGALESGLEEWMMNNL